MISSRYVATGTPMNARLPRIVIKGLVGGALVGCLTAAYVIVLTEDHVIRRDDFAYPLPYEQSQSRYRSTILLAFTVPFAAIGPVIAAASFGSWIRHAVYGLVGGLGLVVGVTLVTAVITNQQPFNMHRGAHSTYIDIARNYVVPAALIVGPVIGILIGRSLCCRQTNGQVNPQEQHNPVV